MFFSWDFLDFGRFEAETLGLGVSPGIEPGYIVFPSHKNNV
jgi:hypothetical protein